MLVKSRLFSFLGLDAALIRKRKLSFPVSDIWQWWVRRSSKAVVILGTSSRARCPDLDRVVSEVTVCARRHAPFGLTLPVVSRRSGRGPRFIVVQLPDGRTRSLLRSITDLEMEHSPAGADSPEQTLCVSVRTLLPLARLLAARSPSREGTGDDGADRSGSPGT